MWKYTLLIFCFLIIGCTSVTPAENTATTKTTTTTEEFFEVPKQVADNTPAVKKNLPLFMRRTTVTEEIGITSQGMGVSTYFTKPPQDFVSTAGEVNLPTKRKGGGAGESSGVIEKWVSGLVQGSSWLILIGGISIAAGVAILVYAKSKWGWCAIIFGAVLIGVSFVIEYAPWLVWMVMGLFVLFAVIYVIGSGWAKKVWDSLQTVTAGIDDLPPEEQEPVRDAIQKRVGGKNSPADDKLKEVINKAKKEFKKTIT